MNLLISIFGGILLTVILYALGRRLRLSNFWAAVMAAGLPSVAYLVYASVAWPGLDVLTLHAVTFPTVAIMINQLYGEKGERPGHMHWVPKLLVLFFVLTTGLFAGFVYIAGNGLPPGLAHWLLPNIEGKTVHTGFAGAVAHGEDAAKSIAHYRRMDATLSRLGWQVEVQGLETLRPDQRQEVRVQVRDVRRQPVNQARVSLSFGRPGQVAKETYPLVFAGEDGYRAQVGLPGGGVWMVMLTLEGAGERVVLEHLVDVK